jgi:hypothetical protein
MEQQMSEPDFMSTIDVHQVPPGLALPNDASPSPARPSERKESQWHGVARVLVLIGALGIVAVGLLVASGGLLMSFLDQADDPLATTTGSLSFLALSAGLGLALAWQAWGAISGRHTGPFQPPRIWAWGLLFVVAVLCGQVILSLDLVPGLTFPLFHIAAAALPPLMILALMGRSLKGTARWRDVVLQTSSGAFLSTFLAFTLEFAAILSALVVGIAIVAVQPGGVDMLQSLAERLQNLAELQDPASLAPLVESPIILVVALLFFAGIIPLIEETVKTLGVGLLAYRRPTLPEAVVWGLASGAGFALTEALFNSISGLDLWAGVVVLRVGASLLHTFTGGLMGLAWYFIVVKRRWLRPIALYAVSVGFHGMWNALATAVSLVSLHATGQEVTATAQGVAGFGILAVLGLLFLLVLAVILGLVWLAHYARQHGQSPQAGEPVTAGTAGAQL